MMEDLHFSESGRNSRKFTDSSSTFFVFAEDDRDHGHTDENSESWFQFLGTDPKQLTPQELRNLLATKSAFNHDHMPHVLFDELNCKLYDFIRPLHWVDPQIPEKAYDMVCIGGGAAGMITAAGTAYMGGRSLIIERSLMGGDCLNTGCVPSKTFLSIANKAHKLRNGKQFGL